MLLPSVSTATPLSLPSALTKSMGCGVVKNKTGHTLASAMAGGGNPGITWAMARVTLAIAAQILLHRESLLLDRLFPLFDLLHDFPHRRVIEKFEELRVGKQGVEVAGTDGSHHGRVGQYGLHRGVALQ